MESRLNLGSGRMFGVDVLRGVCLVEMMANHLPYNFLTRAAVEPVGFVSAAEGFVFLSGLVAGCTCASALLSNNLWRDVGLRMLSRAAQLYATYLVLFTAVLLAIMFGGSQFDEWRKLCYVGSESLERIWLYGAALLHQPSFLDILPLYVVFLAVVPLVIGQIRAGRSRLVLAASFGLWCVSQFWNTLALPSIFELGFFNLFSWQLLFTIGLVLGHQRGKNQDHARQPAWVYVLCAGLCLALFAVRHSLRFGVHPPVVMSFVSKPTLGAIRLLNFAAIACTIERVLRWVGPGTCRYWLCRRLAYIGQHSLQVFAWSIGITYLAFLSGESWRHLAVPAQMFIAMAAVVSLWIPAYIHASWKMHLVGRLRDVRIRSMPSASTSH